MAAENREETKDIYWQDLPFSPYARHLLAILLTIPCTPTILQGRFIEKISDSSSCVASILATNDLRDARPLSEPDNRDGDDDD